MKPVLDESLKTEYIEQPDVKLMILRIRKEYHPKHILKADIYQLANTGRHTSSKLFPLVIAMWEEKDSGYLTDFYSFDNNGVCLSHGYSRVKNDKVIVDEEHDTDISRLLEHKETFKEAIKHTSIPPRLSTATTVMNLFLSK